MSAAPTLVGSLVMLDPVLPRDKYAVYEYCQDPVLQDGVPIPAPYHLTDADYFVGDYAEKGATTDEFTLWAIRNSAGGKLIGAIELRNESLGGANVGYWLAADARGSGRMTEALGLVLEHALSNGFVRVSWDALADNIASAIVARRNGFTFEGRFRLGAAFRRERRDNWRAAFIAGDSRDVKDGWPAEVPA